jgi:hypothetical protein
MAGLDPAIPLNKARPRHVYRDRRVKLGDDGEWILLIRKALENRRLAYMRNSSPR